MSFVDNEILNINRVICRHISSKTFCTRGEISQDILSQLRNFTEAIMFKFYDNNSNLEYTYPNICQAISFVKARGNLRVLNEFHNFLQIVASHYTLNEENSERLMLKYYEYLLSIKKLVKESYSIDILQNLSEFPLNIDKMLAEYYKKISEKINSHSLSNKFDSHKYYIQKIKPFFVNDEIYYEVTFHQALGKTNKTNRIIAFTKLPVTSFYSVKLNIEDDNIDILDTHMHIKIITGWSVAIRECEYKNFRKLFKNDDLTPTYTEQNSINSFLTNTGGSLTDLMDFSESEYTNVINSFKATSKSSIFIEVLNICRQIISTNNSGCNIIRYLLLKLNNEIIKSQYHPVSNSYLSNLYLKNGCIPFDKMPFINSTVNHNPHIYDLYKAIPISNHEHELPARKIKNNTEIHGHIFTPLRELNNIDHIDELVKKYNRALWSGHKERSKLVIDKGHIFINEYKIDTCEILKQLSELSSTGLSGYSNYVESWLSSPGSGVDCLEKKEALKKLFDKSKVSLIYGSAGTGKSTLINHVANLFSSNSKLFLAQTNPAVDNLRRRVSASNSNFSTISKFLNNTTTRTEYDLLIIDECSTVSNKDMNQILSKATVKIIMLVGDTYQINSIRFGNWFSIARNFIPESSVIELKEPFRSNSTELNLLWSRVRNMDNTIEEILARQNYSSRIDASIFESKDNDEITLCLNYDGLYGINNLNRFLQENNQNPGIQWNNYQFKVGDPILFNDSDRFSPIIHNNTKGKILGVNIFDIDKPTEYILFKVEVDKVITELSAFGQDFELIENSTNGKSVIQFKVTKAKSEDDDDTSASSSTLPFQIAYAVSIHKAQGLEYNSVKIVLTDEVDEMITHNIFYTAITRARTYLKIYWSPETEHHILSSIEPLNYNHDICILKQYI